MQNKIPGPRYILVFDSMDKLPSVLVFDGGGVRGLSSLLILRDIIEHFADKSKAEETPRPCEYFDLIGGTGTGGLIAVMLGVLGMVTY